MSAAAIGGSSDDHLRYRSRASAIAPVIKLRGSRFSSAPPAPVAAPEDVLASPRSGGFLARARSALFSAGAAAVGSSSSPGLPPRPDSAASSRDLSQSPAVPETPRRRASTGGDDETPRRRASTGGDDDAGAGAGGRGLWVVVVDSEGPRTPRPGPVLRERIASRESLWLPLEGALHSCSSWASAFGDAYAPAGARTGAGVRARVANWLGVPPPFLAFAPAGGAIEGVAAGDTPPLTWSGLRRAFEGLGSSARPRSAAAAADGGSCAGGETPWARAWAYAHGAANGESPTPPGSPASRVLLLFVSRLALPPGAPLLARSFPVLVELREAGSAAAAPAVVGELWPGSTAADLVAGSSAPGALLPPPDWGAEGAPALALAVETHSGVVAATAGVLRVAAAVAAKQRRCVRMRFGRVVGGAAPALVRLPLLCGAGRRGAALLVSPWDAVANVRVTAAALLGAHASATVLQMGVGGTPLSDAALLGESDALGDDAVPLVVTEAAPAEELPILFSSAAEDQVDREVRERRRRQAVAQAENADRADRAPTPDRGWGCVAAVRRPSAAGLLLGGGSGDGGDSALEASPRQTDRAASDHAMDRASLHRADRAPTPDRGDLSARRLSISGGSDAAAGASPRWLASPAEVAAAPSPSVQRPSIIAPSPRAGLPPRAAIASPSSALS